MKSRALGIFMMFAAVLCSAQSLDVTFLVGADIHLNDPLKHWTRQISQNHVKAMNLLLGANGRRLRWPDTAFTKGDIASPDAVFIAGDLLNGYAATDDAAVGLLRSLYLGTEDKSPLLESHAYIGMGNHDFALHSGSYTINGNKGNNVLAALVRQSANRNLFRRFEADWSPGDYSVPPHYAVTFGGGKLLVVVLSPAISEPCRKIETFALTQGFYADPWAAPCNAEQWLRDTLGAFVAANGGNKMAPVIIVQHYGYDDIGVSSDDTAWRGYWWPPDSRNDLADIIKGYNVIAIIHGHTHGAATEEKQTSQPGFGEDRSARLDVGSSNSRGWARAAGGTKDDFCRIVTKDASDIARCTVFDGTSAYDIDSKKIDTGEVEGRAWVDVNGDGKADYCRVIERNIITGKAKLRCELSTGKAFDGFIESGWLDAGYFEGRAWVDVNHDGKADYCRVYGGGVGCALSTGSGFRETAHTKLDPGHTDSRAWVDVNGDGLLDFCRVFVKTSNNHGIARCSLFDGILEQFTGGTVESGEIDLGDKNGRAFIDINGDGAADFCRPTDYVYAWNSIGAIRCTLSTKTAFSSDRFSKIEEYPGGARSRGIDLGFADARAWVKFDSTGNLSYCRVLEKNGGSEGRVGCAGFTRVNIASRRLDPGFLGGRAWADINGDGRADYCRVTDSDTGMGTVRCLLAADIVSKPAADTYGVASGLCTGDKGNNEGGFAVVHVTDTTFELLDVEKPPVPRCEEASYDGSVTPRTLVTKTIKTTP